MTKYQYTYDKFHFNLDHVVNMSKNLWLFPEDQNTAAYQRGFTNNFDKHDTAVCRPHSSYKKKLKHEKLTIFYLQCYSRKEKPIRIRILTSTYNVSKNAI